MTRINISKLVAEYAVDRAAVRKCAAENGVSIQAVYYQMDRAGVPRRRGGDASVGTQAAEKNPNWKNGTTIRKDGYVLERRGVKQLAQHRIVAEQMLGRPLLPGECVHHKNGDRSDNRPENLEVLPSHSDHMRLHCDRPAMSARGKKGNSVRWGIAALKARKGAA